MDWHPASWRSFEARQQPDYPDRTAVAAAESALAGRPPLVAPGSLDALRSVLAGAQAGRAFLVQGGECAESFGQAPEAVAATLDLLDAMAARIESATGRRAARVGRIAGQFAKPRSQSIERRGEAALPAWRGDLVNGLAFDAGSRRADPARMVQAYDEAATTLARLPAHAFASHEALLLPWEQALARRDPASGRWFAGSAHFLWIGERTLFPGSAHVEFARGIANPIGLKCGPALRPDILLRLLDQLDPDGEPGRITLIARMGSELVAAALPPLLNAVARTGRPVLWCCDPMHGNTLVGADGRKRRPLARIFAEAEAFFELAWAAGIAAGGLHVELTGEDVTECGAGGGQDSRCDPRLNPGEALALAERVAEAAAREPAPARLRA